MKKIIPSSLDTRESYKLLTQVVTPRPIAFVSTVNKNGLPNAAPFCFFMPITPTPQTIALSIIRRGETKKDTIKNIESSRDFVINIVDEKLASAMNMASGSYPPDMSEFDVTGLTPIASEVVSSPRIQESPIHLECKLKTILEWGDVMSSLVIAEVVCIHLHESILTDQQIDFKKLGTIGRIGEHFYVKTTSNTFEMTRPA